jgi:type I restriction enzyme S subunit
MIPQEWQARRFAEVADYKAGRTPARARTDYWHDAKDGIPWVAISDMTEFGTVTETKEKITDAAFKQVFRSRIVPAGTLLMSFKLTIGRIATLGTDACHNEAIISIFPRQGVDQRFLGYFLAQVDYDALQDRQVKGNTLNQDKIDRIEIWLPPQDEQAHIADVLELVRRAIHVQEAAILTSVELKRGAMRLLLSRGLREQAQKETEIGLIPESWEARELGRHFNIKHGFAFDGDHFRPSGEYTLLTPGHFSEEGGFRNQGAKTKYFVGEFDPQYLLRPGDLLVAMTEQKAGLLGSAAFIPDTGKFLHNQRLGLIIDLDERSLDRRYLYHLMNCESVREEIARTSTGSKVKHTSPSRIGAVVAPFPPIEEQRAIAATFDAIDSKVSLHSRKREVLEELFDALLHDLMKGRVRVADLDLSGLTKEPMAELAA